MSDDIIKKFKNSRLSNNLLNLLDQSNGIKSSKKGSKIHIKKENRGKFTDYCGGKVTEECIQRGKNSPDPKIRKRATFAKNARAWKHQNGGSLLFNPSQDKNIIKKERRFSSYKKYSDGGSLPIGNRNQYNHVVSIYKSLLNRGVSPQAALELTNQKIAEKGWTGYSTGDNKRFDTVDQFTQHLIDWHGKMYPESLKANNFEEFWKGIQITPKYKYNSENPDYKKLLLKTRPGVKKRINFYREKQGLPPLALMSENNIYEMLS